MIGLIIVLALCMLFDNWRPIAGIILLYLFFHAIGKH